jgi:hypothetical protein
MVTAADPVIWDSHGRCLNSRETNESDDEEDVSKWSVRKDQTSSLRLNDIRHHRHILFGCTRTTVKSTARSRPKRLFLVRLTIVETATAREVRTITHDTDSNQTHTSDTPPSTYRLSIDHTSLDPTHDRAEARVSAVLAYLPLVSISLRMRPLTSPLRSNPSHHRPHCSTVCSLAAPVAVRVWV